MFPLQMLALIFISTLRNQNEVKEEKGKQEEEVVGSKDRTCEEMLRRGDLLVVPRTLFTHFGIYLGGGR